MRVLLFPALLLCCACSDPAEPPPAPAVVRLSAATLTSERADSSYVVHFAATYDEGGYLVQLTQQLDGADVGQADLAYDGGRLVGIAIASTAGGSEQHTLTYDGEDVTEYTVERNGAHWTTGTFSLHPDDRRLVEETTWTLTAGADSVVRYDYDDDLRLTSVDRGTSTEEYAYDDGRRLTNWTSTSPDETIHAEIEYDGDRIVSQLLDVGIHRTFAYDDNGRMTETGSTGSGADRTFVYEYEAGESRGPAILPDPISGFDLLGHSLGYQPGPPAFHLFDLEMAISP